MKGIMKLFGGLAVLWTLIVIAFWVAVIWVVVHFARKWW